MLAIENEKKIQQMRDETEELKSEKINLETRLKNKQRQEQEIKDKTENIDNEIDRLETLLRGEYQKF